MENSSNTALQRGKILRDTSVGEGLVFVNGQQHSFRLEGVWKSPVAPKVNMVVDVAFDTANNVASLLAVDEAELAKEQGKKALDVLKSKSVEGLNQLTAKIDKPALISIAAIAVAWQFLNIISINIGSGQKFGITFHDVLTLINGSSNMLSSFQGGYLNSSASAGVYIILMIGAITAPALPFFTSHRHAPWGLFAPLVLMLGVSAKIYFDISDAVTAQQNSMGALGALLGKQTADQISKLSSEMVSGVLQAIHLGFGFYIAAAASVYLAYRGGMKLLASHS